MVAFVERPSCSHCLKVSSAQGYPAEGILCLYSAKSIFAKEEDIELEAKFGKSARCLWSRKPILALSTKEEEIGMETEEKGGEEAEMIREEGEEAKGEFLEDSLRDELELTLPCSDLLHPRINDDHSLSSDFSKFEQVKHSFEFDCSLVSPSRNPLSSFRALRLRTRRRVN